MPSSCAIIPWGILLFSQNFQGQLGTQLPSQKNQSYASSLHTTAFKNPLMGYLRVNLSESNTGTGFSMDKTTQSGFALDDTIWDSHFTAQSRQKDNQLKHKTGRKKHLGTYQAKVRLWCFNTDYNLVLAIAQG